MSDPKPKLGYVGTGLMGGPMTMRLLAAGYEVAVWNRTREKILPLLEAGASEADGPGDLAAQADVVMMCLTDAKAVEEVVFGGAGVASGGAAGKLLVDFSSMRPDTTREFEARLRSEAGMGWIDAPVSGGVKGAEEGTLAILAGGEAAEIERVRPILAHLSQRVTHMGPSGAGQVTKLCNQVIVGSNLATIAEAISLAEKSGVDASQLAEALKGGFGDSIPLQIFGPRYANRQYEPFLGHVFTMLKDLDTALDLGGAKSADLPMAAKAAELLRRAEEKGWAEEDITRLIELFE